MLGNFEKILKFIDENSIEKLNFLFFIFFENLLLKIELSEITPFFYNIFFGFGGWDFAPFPPWLRPCFGWIVQGQWRKWSRVGIGLAGSRGETPDFACRLMVGAPTVTIARPAETGQDTNGAGS